MPASLTIVMYAFMGLPLLVLVLFNLLGKKLAERSCLAVGALTGLIQVAAALISLALLWQYNKASVKFSQFWDMTASADAAYFSLDVLSLVALVCIGMVAVAAFITARTTIRDKAFNFTNVLLLLMLGMNGIALVTDLFSLYVFLEVTGVSSFILIALRRDVLGLEGSFKYFVLSAIASAFILVGLAFLFMEAGSLRYDAIQALFASGAAINPILLMLGMIFFISGLSIKCGLVPFHGWLPDAYQSAPAAVSVMLSGIVTKMAGAYAVIRLLGSLINDYSVINLAFVLLALTSIVIGAVAAIAQKDFKRILAYSSISQIGYIILGVACGNFIGLVGAVLHFFNHATFKTTLFVNAAAVEKQTGTMDIGKLGGLQKQMPVTGVASIIAFLSAAGIPPLAGFWSKLLIIIATWQIMGPVIAGIALFVSLLTAAYFLRLQRRVFFGPEEEHLVGITEAKGGIRGVSLALSVVTVLAGLLFPMLLLLLRAQGLL